MVYSAHVGAPSGAPSVEAVVCCGRKDPQVAAFGHGGVFVEGAFFYKPRPKARDRYENERRFLELICCRCESGEPLRTFVPHFYGEVERDGAWFFKMDDLLHAFSPRGRHIADLKMGLRTFAESEAQSAEPRADLFERMERMEERLGSRALDAGLQIPVFSPALETTALGSLLSTALKPRPLHVCAEESLPPSSTFSDSSRNRPAGSRVLTDAERASRSMTKVGAALPLPTLSLSPPSPAASLLPCVLPHSARPRARRCPFCPRRSLAATSLAASSLIDASPTPSPPPRRRPSPPPHRRLPQPPPRRATRGAVDGTYTTTSYKDKTLSRSTASLKHDPLMPRTTGALDGAPRLALVDERARLPDRRTAHSARPPDGV